MPFGTPMGMSIRTEFAMATERKFPERRKTCVRLNETGHAHALTFSCFRRLPLLGKAQSCQWLADAIRQAATKHDFDVWAYVMMPEHVHLVLCPREKIYSISKILGSIKQPVARRAIAFLKCNAPKFLEQLADEQSNGLVTHRFWLRGGGYDRNITEPNTLLTEIKYLHANPVKRKLVAKEEDWHWSSAADYHLNRKGPIPISFESLPFEMSLLSS